MMPDLAGPDKRPGTITENQRLDLIGILLRDRGAWSRAHRMEWLTQRIPGWDHGGDLGWLSQKQAGDLLAAANGIGAQE
jgi:hypothetical protein